MIIRSTAFILTRIKHNTVPRWLKYDLIPPPPFAHTPQPSGALRRTQHHRGGGGLRRGEVWLAWRAGGHRWRQWSHDTAIHTRTRTHTHTHSPTELLISDTTSPRRLFSTTWRRQKATRNHVHVVYTSSHLNPVKDNIIYYFKLTQKTVTKIEKTLISKRDTVIIIPDVQGLRRHLWLAGDLDLRPVKIAANPTGLIVESPVTKESIRKYVMGRDNILSRVPIVDYLDYICSPEEQTGE